MRSTRIALALLVLLAPIFGAVAIPAAAAESDYSKSFEGTGDTRVVGFDTSGWSADTFTVEVSTNNGPGDNHVVLYREQHDLASIPKGDDGWVWFENAGAYNQITVTVKETSNEPSFGIGSDTSTVSYPNDARLASTGGDRDLIADPLEKLATATNPAVNIVDVSVGRGGLPDSTSVNETSLAELDANETRMELYQSAAASKDSADTIHAIMTNRLQDAETVALIKGKNAYIRSLNSAGSETAARTTAKQNISEFYSLQERNLLSEWNSQISQAEYLNGLAQNESELQSWYIDVYRELNRPKDASSDDHYANISSFGSTQFTLQNGTSVDVRTVKISVYDTESVGSTTYTIGPTTGRKNHTADDGINDFGNALDLLGLMAYPPNENTDALNFTEFEKYERSLDNIDSQATSARSQMDTVVDQTYSQYQAGEINSTDLVNPYDLQNQANPGDDFQGWAAATLAVSGTNQPTDFDSTGYMNVTLEDGSELQGIIHSTENPPNGQFEVNETYDPSVVNGTQYLVTDDRLRELTQNFTLTNITTTDGEYRQNFTVVQKNYSTTSAEDLEKLNQQMAELRSEIEARQQATRGGGAIFSGDNSMFPYILIGGGLIFILYQNSNNGGNNGNGGSRRSSNGGGRSRRRY